jgi:hypothetical protein
MRKTVLLIGAIALLSASAWAVDGQVLINQSTVMSSGGFPYHITQTGSYKLSGNLVAPLNQQAIQIIASNVTLDLNGFNVTCNFDANYPRVFQFSCLGDGGYGVGASDVSIRNGTVTATQTGGDLDIFHIMNAVGFLSSFRLTVEDLHIWASATAAAGTGLNVPVNSIIRHNILSGTGGGINRQCPSLIEGNINTTGGGGGGGNGCVYVNNIGVF